MKLETDLKVIKRLARMRREENLDFRAYLKELPFSSRRIDLEVQRLLKHVTARIDCKECGNCCREKQPVLGQAEILRLAKQLAITPTTFRRRFLKPAPSRISGMIFKRRPCPLLKAGICSLYRSRPGDCRSYPHLHRKDFVRRTLQAVENYGECPIVFNVYELLKPILARRIRPPCN